MDIRYIKVEVVANATLPDIWAGLPSLKFSNLTGISSGLFWKVKGRKN